MMVPRNSVTCVIFLVCGTTITRAGNHLVNDTCHTVWMREDITKKAAQVVCNEYARVFDPKSQNGSYFLEDTGNWIGGIFACLCSCRLPFDPENGQILSKNIIRHGETLYYSCNDGYEKNIKKKIVCYDGLLMTVPDYLETQHINTSSRQKSLPDWFANDFDGKVFDLWLNETANWSIPEIEVQRNQKVFQILTKNEMVLQYYVCSWKGCMLGCINWGIGGIECISLGIRGLECMKMISGTTTTASSNQGQPWILPVFIVVIIFAVIIIVAIIIFIAIVKHTKKKRTGRQQKERALPLIRTAA